MPIPPVSHFQKTILAYYRRHGRTLPWRDKPTPYWVFVSEVMLQQTQVPRVLPKFKEFITRFSDFKTLAQARPGEVVKMWQGLGYNRRALNLHRAAQLVVREHAGKLPTTVETLDALPGIGYATACSIAAFAFNKPVVFIETNIRTVFLHFFFPNKTNVDDKELWPFIEKTLDRKKPREWYWALMDYGVYLKQTVGNVSKRSRQYTKQSTFATSNRRIRGLIIKQFVASSRLTEKQLGTLLQDVAPAVLERNMATLRQEGFLTKTGTWYHLS